MILRRIIQHLIYVIFCSVTYGNSEPNVSSHQQILAESASDFAADVNTKIVALIYGVSLIDPQTDREDRIKLNEVRSKQSQLYKWFNDHGRLVSLDDCITDEDKQNYSQYRLIMADYEFLKLPLKQRCKFIAQIKKYGNYFQHNFPKAILTFLTQNSAKPTKAVHQDVLNFINMRLNIELKMKIWHFNQNDNTRIYALYTPDNHHIYLNLNAMYKNTTDFIDAFEHELWHHLLPPRGINNISENIWWEGFTETVAEYHKSFLYSGNQKSLIEIKFNLNSNLIQYPIESAIASIYLGFNRPLTLSYLCNFITRNEFAQQLMVINKEESLERQSIANVLGKLLLKIDKFDPNEVEKLNTLMSTWGWREDDGTKISLTHIFPNGQIDDKILETLFRQDDTFLVDLIQAVAGIKLKKLLLNISDSEKEILTKLDLPSHLLGNIRRVIGELD